MTRLLLVVLVAAAASVAAVTPAGAQEPTLPQLQSTPTATPTPSPAPDGETDQVPEDLPPDVVPGPSPEADARNEEAAGRGGGNGGGKGRGGDGEALRAVPPAPSGQVRALPAQLPLTGSEPLVVAMLGAAFVLSGAGLRLALYGRTG